MESPARPGSLVPVQVIVQLLPMESPDGPRASITVQGAYLLAEGPKPITDGTVLLKALHIGEQAILDRTSMLYVEESRIAPASPEDAVAAILAARNGQNMHRES